MYPKDRETYLIYRKPVKESDEEIPQTIKPTFTINVFDENKKLLDGEKFVVYQKDKKKYEGILKKGQAIISGIDKQKPFIFAVEGRVSAIASGAVLLTEAPGVEYGGGTFVDWHLADDQSPSKTDIFWKEYRRLLIKNPKGPSSFWQHQHITRRPILLRKAYQNENGKSHKTAAIMSIPLQIRTGPMVRFTNYNSTVIWVELETPGFVRVRYSQNFNWFERDHVSYGVTVRVGGRHYAAIPITGLSEDTLYYYMLDLAPIPATGQIPTEASKIAGIFPSLNNRIRENIKGQLKGLSFDKNGWLSFHTLRKRYDKNFRFAFGSCRVWPHDKGMGTKESKIKDSGPDGLENLGIWLVNAVKTGRKEIPDFLLLIGDQIYADDVGIDQGQSIYEHRFAAYPGFTPAHEFLWRTILKQRVAVEWKELIGKINGAWAGRFASRVSPFMISALENKPMARTNYIIANRGLWEVPVERKDVPCRPEHLSNIPSDYKSAGDSRPRAIGQRIHAADFAEYTFLYESAWTSLEPVRIVLANIPTFMIFDDHEITDDWNYDYKWSDMVYVSPRCALEYWPDTISDGLIAYWMYQGWGNIAPSEWSTDQRTRILLDHQSLGKDALPALRQLIKKSLPDMYEVRRDKDARPQVLLSWDYRLPIESPLFYVLDVRTDRVFLPDRPTNIEERLVSKTQLARLKKQLTSIRDEIAFVVSSLPMLLPGLLAMGMRAPGFGYSSIKWFWTEINEKIRRERDMEHWPSNHSWYDLQELLSDLSKNSKTLKTIVALSGDLHFSYNMLGKLDNAERFGIQGARQDKDGTLYPYLLQLVSSPIKKRLEVNTEMKTRMLIEDDTVVENYKRKVSSDVKNIRHYYYDNKFVRNWYTWEGMRLRLGGFEGITNRAVTVLAKNTVALVDIRIEPETGKGVSLTTHYLTNNVKPIITFRYVLNPKGLKFTEPEFK